MNDFFDLKNKLAIVTGASSGLGERFAQVLAQFGCHVIVGARRKEKLDSLVSKIESAGGKASSCSLDLSNEESIDHFIQNIEEMGKPVDILVNNAGVAGMTPFDQFSAENWDKQFDVNLRGPWLLASRIALQMKDMKTRGSIINISSINGGNAPYPGASAYCASKAGMIQMTKVLAGELSKFGIRVNSILPGLIETDMTAAKIVEKRDLFEKKIPLGFIAECSDLDGALLFLVSNKASRYVTGAEIVVDGGLSANCTVV